MVGFQEQLQRDAASTERMLASLLDAQTGTASRLAAAMRHAVLNGGKRMRAAMLIGAARLAADSADDDSPALRAAAAVEFIHAYSLIHDDLPAMDNADTRRGKPSCHILFDEATAILAGDALQTLAFETLADEAVHPDPKVRLALIQQLAVASGVAGMAGGQMLDLEAETGAFDLTETKQMQMMKTGALISCAVISGGLVGAADEKLRTALTSFSRHLGLAFQIADDLLDYGSTAEQLGKPAGRDKMQGKAGFVALMGYDRAQNEAQELIEAAKSALAPWQAKANYLCCLAEFAITRKT